MISILGFLAKFSIVAFLGGFIFSSFSDFIFNTNYLIKIDNFFNMEDSKISILMALLSLVYLLVFLLDFINKLTKYSQNRKIKNKNSELEVTIKTINELSKEFLSKQEIIKNTKVKSYPKGKKAVIIEAVVDTYNTEKLSEKLVEIQDELSSYVENITGIEVNKSKIKVKKILSETTTEKSVLNEVEKIQDVEEVKEED